MNRLKTLTLFNKGFKSDFSVNSIKVEDSLTLIISGGIKQVNQKVSVLSGFITKELTGTFISTFSAAKALRSIFHLLIFNTLFGWYLRYSVIGYNFSFRHNTFRRVIRLNLGFSRHKFVITIPRSTSLHQKGGRRKIIIISSSLSHLVLLANFIHNARNILPYKLRGMVLERSKLSVLKQGKKVKFR